MASPAVIKIGPCGGSGGSAQDITVEPKRLQSITIRSGAVIDSIGFSFLDNAGNSRSAGPWGGTGGQAQVVSDIYACAFPSAELLVTQYSHAS
jgi:hypothetical protein